MRSKKVNLPNLEKVGNGPLTPVSWSENDKRELSAFGKIIFPTIFLQLKILIAVN